MTESGRKLPWIAKAYLIVVIISGFSVAALYASGRGAGWALLKVDTVELTVAALLSIAVAFFSEMYPILIPSTRMFDDGGDEWTVSSAVYIADLLLFGPAFTILVSVAAVLLSDLCLRKPFYKAAFNAGQYALTVGISGLFLLDVAGDPYLVTPLLGSLRGFAPMAGSLALYFLLNSSLVAVVVALVDGVAFPDVWAHLVRHSVAQYAAMLTIGLVAAILWSVTPFSLVLLVPPMLVVHLALKATAQLKSETAQALIAIAGMVDARDSYAYRHSQEVARYTVQIATKMGLPIEQVEAIKLAAQLHDIGKIGTPDEVLHKPGKLDPEERARMEEHPEAGGKVLKYFSLFRSGADLVLYHQEHYDGSGYPRGLAGEQIPLGARIIHVADAFQAMTSDRVYRKALGVDEAIARLQADAGRQFDPVVVKALVEALEESGIRASEAPAEIREQSLALQGG